MTETAAAPRCALIVEILPLSPELPESEAQDILERALRRAQLACAPLRGRVQAQDSHRLYVLFSSCDAAISAVSAVFERIEDLPPPAGQPVRARIGLHHGVQASPPSKPLFADRVPVSVTSGSPAVREPFYTAIQIVDRAQAGEALASQAVVRAAKQGAGYCIASVQSAPLFQITRHFTGGTKTMPTRLELRYQDFVFHIDDHHPILLLGRERGNDIVINNTRTSRQHARIEWRKGGFVLTDHSTNGTYVLTEGGSSVARKITHDTTELVGNGLLGCGWSPADASQPTIFYRIDDNSGGSGE